MPGADERRHQTATYQAEWLTDNESALARPGPLWVVLGDSTAQGIGTSNREHSYALVVLRALREQRDPTWRALNVSRSGARVRDVVNDQLLQIEHTHADLVSCAAGANDLLRTRPQQFERDLRQLAGRLPAGSLLANLPQGLMPKRAARFNALISELVVEHGLLLVDVWSHTGPPWEGKFSGDRFHPNDAGYLGWAAAFLDALGLAPPPAA
jgi:lysophospholipase L1-like esterase